MELKRIIARDSRSANEKAIQMYGQDVLIISSHKVDNQIELVVAVETLPEVDAAPAQHSFKPFPVLAQAEPEQASQSTPTTAFARVFEEEMVHSPAQPNAAAAPGSEHDMVMDALTALSRRVVSAPAEAPQPQAWSSPPAAPLPLACAPEDQSPMPAAVSPASADMMHDFRRSQETVELLRQEMSALRQEFALSRQMAVWQGGLGLAPEIEQLWNQLLELGMPARLRSLLLDSVRTLSSVEQARGMVFQLLADALNRSAMAPVQQGVHALCGPSGAGKTLMAVRLARQACATVDAQQQAIISYCDQRPGAWSQLQVLAAQTGVECYKANDPQTLKLLLDDLSGRQAIWIDTPGTDFLTHAETLRKVVPTVSLHAVLPVDASVTSVQKVLETPDMPWASLMLSKFDEAAHPWPLIQGLCNNALGVSVVSQSASLANAPLAFEPAKLVEMALSPLGEMPMVLPKKKPTRKRASPAVESPKTVVAKRSRSTAKVMNA